MLAKRLELWQLSEFSLERLASVEDVYLFRGVANDNPDDERLFALAEVRDLTPVRDESGKVVALPHLERMTLQALAAMRTALARLAHEGAAACATASCSTCGPSGTCPRRCGRTLPIGSRP